MKRSLRILVYLFLFAGGPGIAADDGFFEIIAGEGDTASFRDTLSVAVDTPVLEPRLRIEGLVVDNATGEYPSDDSVVVKVNGNFAIPDSQGMFSFELHRASVLLLSVESRAYKEFRTVVPVNDSNPYFFVTCGLDSAEETSQTGSMHKTVRVDTFATLPWVISGTIIDSRFDLAIENDSTLLTFDGQTLDNVEEGSFRVTTPVGGRHLFRLRIPGYQEVVSEIVLVPENRRPFFVIPTAPPDKDITRREITVRAESEPVHQTAEVARERISRKDLQRTAATHGDPVRVLHSLPSVASVSDFSARPIVRGGDPMESRVVLDGISLLQPYHFGSVRSTFNQQALEDIVFYRAGYPAHLYNAQSSVIDARTRVSTDEPAFEFDVNALQGALYLGIPMRENRLGIHGSVQGSFYEYVQKGSAWLAGTVSDNPDLQQFAEHNTMPGYKDLSLGLSAKPNDRLTIRVNEMLNTDIYRMLEPDSSGWADLYRDTCRYYGFGYPCFRKDTTVRFEKGEDLWDHSWDSLKTREVSRYTDTLMNYRSNYNLLYATTSYAPDEKSLFEWNAAWQRRWWDLTFPEPFSYWIDSSEYDVSIDDISGSFAWDWSGIPKHHLKFGLQGGMNTTSYDVYMVRTLHEIIINGNTNTGDFWGPVSGDSSVTYTDYYWDESAHDLLGRIFVVYAGKRRYWGGALFAEDRWSPLSRLSIEGGARVEATTADSSITVSPRLMTKFGIHNDHELLLSVGRYTQNNYDPSAIALAENLTPEKVWHFDLGFASRFFSHLEQKVNVYAKRYSDLLSEVIETNEGVSLDSLIESIEEEFEGREDFSEDELYFEAANRFVNSGLLETRYVNDGSGYALGIEYFLRYRPVDFWHGWVSFSYGRSFRRRRPGWRIHPFPLERPLLVSVVNYYRLPRRYEFAFKYRYMSGIPYTETTMRDESFSVGNYNEKRYKPYQSLDFRISRGFGRKFGIGHVYFEILNAFNSPNIFQLDSKSGRMKSLSFNIPSTVVHVGVNYELHP